MFKTVLALFILSVFLPRQATAQQAGNVGYAQVIDANERVVGPLLNPGFDANPGHPDLRASVLVKVGQYYFTLKVDQNGLIADGSPVYFTSSDCSGTEYIRVDKFPPSGYFAVVSDRYFFAETPFAMVDFKSTAQGGPKGVTCRPAGGRYLAGVKGIISKNALNFAPPFSVRVAPSQP